MSKIVRSSKYRHVFGNAFKREQCWDGLRASRTAWDTNYLKVNGKFFGLLWEAGGGGAFTVMPLDSPGKYNTVPLITGHTGAVLDIDFHPFNDNLIASASEDSYVKLWQIPDGGLKDNVTDPVQTLSGHGRKVGSLLFHPSASNVLVSSSADQTVKIWDIEKGQDMLTIEGHTDLIQGCDWNADGSMLVSSCKDKKVRILDPRQRSIAAEANGLQGPKGFRVTWMGQKNKIFSAGFVRSNSRGFTILDPRRIEEPLCEVEVDQSSGQFMPFYDDDTGVMFLVGKGDCNILYYEIIDESPYQAYLSKFSSTTPTKGCAVMPKRYLNINSCEIMRMFRLNNDNKVEPLEFVVPRKSEAFQDDIFPDCVSGEPALTADAWFSGQSALPNRVSCRTLFDALVSGQKANSSSSSSTTVNFKQNASSSSASSASSTPKDLQSALARIRELEAKVAQLEAQLAQK